MGYYNKEIGVKTAKSGENKISNKEIQKARIDRRNIKREYEKAIGTIMKKLLKQHI